MHDQMTALGGGVRRRTYARQDVASRALHPEMRKPGNIADLAGGTLAAATVPALRPGGQIAAIATPELDLDPLLDANITFHGVLIGDDGDRTRALTVLLDRRALRPVISHVLPLAKAAQAHRILEGLDPGGKIVLDIASSEQSPTVPAAPRRCTTIPAQH